MTALDYLRVLVHDVFEIVISASSGFIFGQVFQTLAGC